MKKIHKSYGMDSDLYYFDIDFSGRIIPWERDLSVNTADRPVGSGIRIHHGSSDKYLSMSSDRVLNVRMLRSTCFMIRMGKNE